MNNNLCTLQFNELRDANVARNALDFPESADWKLTDWGNALAGETGEACNIVKKMRRLDAAKPDNLRDYELGQLRKLLAKELADVVSYADHLARAAGIDLGEAFVLKFNEVSDRRGSAIKLTLRKHWDFDAPKQTTNKHT